MISTDKKKKMAHVLNHLVLSSFILALLNTFALFDGSPDCHNHLLFSDDYESSPLTLVNFPPS